MKTMIPPKSGVSDLQSHELIPANQIERNPLNRTPDPEKLARLVESIRDVGVMQPITVRPVGDKLQIVMGECRWAACAQIDETFPVPCFVRQMDDKTATKLMAVENFQRDDLDVVDQSNAIRNMKEAGWVLEEVGEALGLTTRYVQRILAVTRLPEEVLPWVREGLLAIDTCEAIAFLPEELRLDAARDCAKPEHSAEALPKREAKALLDRKYIDPLKKTGEWKERRTALENEFAPAKWLDYEAARDLGRSRDWVEALERPDYWLLSDAFQGEGVEVPTWLELARRHGGEEMIGMDYQGTPAVYVEWRPLVDAEIARNRTTPNLCIFEIESEEEEEEEENEDALREAAEREAARKERVRQAMFERDAVVAKLLKGKLPKEGAKVLVKNVATSMVMDFLDEGHVKHLLGMEEESSASEMREKLRELLDKGSAFEALGRFVVAHEVLNTAMTSTVALLLVETGCTDEEESPALASFVPGRKEEA